MPHGSFVVQVQDKLSVLFEETTANCGGFFNMRKSLFVFKSLSECGSYESDIVGTKALQRAVAAKHWYNMAVEDKHLMEYVRRSGSYIGICFRIRIAVIRPI